MWSLHFLHLSTDPLFSYNGQRNQKHQTIYYWHDNKSLNKDYEQNKSKSHTKIPQEHWCQEEDYIHTKYKEEMLHDWYLFQHLELVHLGQPAVHFAPARSHDVLQVHHLLVVENALVTRQLRLRRSTARRKNNYQSLTSGVSAWDRPRRREAGGGGLGSPLPWKDREEAGEDGITASATIGAGVVSEGVWDLQRYSSRSSSGVPGLVGGVLLAGISCIQSGWGRRGRRPNRESGGRGGVGYT